LDLIGTSPDVSGRPVGLNVTAPPASFTWVADATQRTQEMAEGLGVIYFFFVVGFGLREET